MYLFSLVSQYIYGGGYRKWYSIGRLINHDELIFSNWQSSSIIFLIFILMCLLFPVYKQAETLNHLCKEKNNDIKTTNQLNLVPSN